MEGAAESSVRSAFGVPQILAIISVFQKPFQFMVTPVVDWTTAYQVSQKQHMFCPAKSR